MKRLVLFAGAFLLVAVMARAGETIRFVAVNHTWTTAIKPLIPDFEKETGIKVRFESFGEDQLQQRLAVEFSGGTTDIDVFITRPLQEAKMMIKNGWIEDLTPYFADDEEYDFPDFTTGSINCTNINGFQACIPGVNENEILYYRKDLLEAKGLKVPTTYEEMEEAARILHDPENEVYGFIARGMRSPLVTQFSSYLYGFGGDFYDEETMTATVDTPEFLAAADYYGRMLRNYGPPGVLNMSGLQAVAVFGQGKAALFTDASSTYPNILDPAKSSVAHVTECAVLPAGPVAHKTFDVTAWGMAIAASSQKKDAAWKFVRYMTDKKRTMIIQGDNANQCARRSVYETPEGTKSFPKSWVKAVQESAPIGVGRDRPFIVAVSEARDAIGEVVVDSILGKDFKTTAVRAQTRFQEILDREK